MEVTARAFWTPKARYSRREYEDAYAPKRHDGTCAAFRCAVADGASEASFSGMWARQLVRAYCRGALDLPDLDALPTLQAEWRAHVYRRPLRWYAEEKARAGAFAALVGLELASRDSGGEWRAIALGDSCLAQVREDGVLAHFPLARAEDFSDRPGVLLSSRPERNDETLGHFRSVEGAWESGDAFFLLSDAIAHWFMERVEAGDLSWMVLRDFGTPHEPTPFATWVQELRDAKQMKNDDTTLLRVDVL